MVALKYLRNFWRTFEISFINLILTWSANCFIIEASANNQIPIFEKYQFLCSSYKFFNLR